MNIKSIIGIVSCKGGVGKSTIAVNLATILALSNKKVGLLDADIYGPNHPRMLGVVDKFNAKMNLSDKLFTPVFKHNLLSMSMGYFLDDNSSVLLRGPMISNTIKFLYSNTDWGDLDFLIIDFPPGTGDIYLSLFRDLIFSGVVLVTMPQIVSVEDVKKSILMLNTFDINIYCLIENMKYLSCDKCGYLNYIFGENNFAKQLANDFFISKYYELPINKFISESSNKGIPFVLNNNCTKDLLNIFQRISDLFK